MSQRSPRDDSAAEAPPAPDVGHLVTEDGEPVDSFLSEKQMRLLTAPLYASWKTDRRFIAASNVGVFAVPKNPALVPDVFLSLDIDVPPITGPARQRSYFVWELGKPPDVVIEIVSDTEGGELTDKLRDYERMRVGYYVVFDPLLRLSEEELMVFSLDGLAYTLRTERLFPSLGLGLACWDGVFETSQTRWLRWTQLDGQLIPSGEEEATRADEERARADQLAARLRALGVEPDDP